MAVVPKNRIGAPPDPMVPEPYRVKSVKNETHDTYTLFLEPADRARSVMAYKPGQFNMLYVPGKGEVPISISGAAYDTSALVHTIRAVGTTTKAICGLRRGEVIGVRGPFGTSWPVKAAEGCDLVVIAGGIGLAPLRPAFYSLLAHRGRFGRIILLYGARRPEEMLYVKELEKWRARFDLEVEVTVDNAASEWYGDVGVVTTLIPRATFDPEDAVALVCGPEIMMRFTVTALLEREIPREQIYLSMERNMKCAIGLCGHCQYGPTFICKDGPVFSYAEIEHLMKIRGL